MTTHTTPDVRREDAIDAPPRRPARVPADRYYSAAFAQLEAQPGVVLTQDNSVLAVINMHRNLDRYRDLPAEDRITGGEPGGGGS